MTLEEMKKKTLGLIEELNPDSEHLTDDPDLSMKHNEVTNQVMFELVRIKKIARYIELPVKAGDIVTFEDLEKECGNEVYQIANVAGVNREFKANGTIVKILSDGTAEIDVYVYPERITEKTKDKAYEFELSADVLEIMPYGIAADLLKSDISADYGRIYAERYESMLGRLDPRYNIGTIYFDGGYDL
jgi:hypothetical protein